MWAEVRPVDDDAQPQHLGARQAVRQGERGRGRSRFMIDEFHLVGIQRVDPMPVFGMEVVERADPVRSVPGCSVTEEERRVVDEMDESPRPSPDREVGQRA